MRVVRTALGATLIASVMFGCGDLGFVIALDGGAGDASVDAFGPVDATAADQGPRDLGPEPVDGAPRDAFRPDGFRADAFRPDAFVAEDCTNRMDDDGDGDTDCFDSSCAGHTACQPVDPEVCTNGVDDDDDGATDCDDGDCAGRTTCGTISDGVLECLNTCVFLPESEIPACHLDCQTSMGVQGSRETNCTDGLDNDDDGQTDSADFDC